MTQQAQQGHAYSWRGEKVIALAHGSRVEVRTIDDGWWGRKFTADAIELEPLPMRYFWGECPVKKTTLSFERAARVIDYDPLTGEMSWKTRTAQRIHVGDKIGRANSTGYLQFRLDRVTHCVHRVAWLLHYGTLPTCDIDHVDRDRSNNRISNLRLVDRSTNLENTLLRSDNKSGYKGVFWHKAAGRYHAVIMKNGIKWRLGSFKCPKDAYAAYCEAAASVHTINPSANQVPA